MQSNDLLQDPRYLLWQSGKKRVRFMVLLNLLAIALFVVWDLSYYPDKIIILVIIRFGVVWPMGMMLIAATYHPKFWLIHQWGLTVAYVVAGSCLIWIRVVCQQQDPSEAMLTWITLVFVAVGLQFSYAILVVFIVLIVYGITHTLLIPYSITMIGAMSVLFSTAGMGAAGSYFELEWSKKLFDHKTVRRLTRYTTAVPDLIQVIAKWRAGTLKRRLQFESVSIERHYQQEYARVTQNKRRLASLVSVAFQGVLSVLDALFEAPPTLMTIIRYCIVVPIAVASFGLTFTKYRKRLNFGVVASVGVFLATCVSVSVSVSLFRTPIPDLDMFATSRFLLALFFGFLFSPIAYWMSLLCGLVSCVLHSVLLLVFTGSVGVSELLFQTICVLLGTFASYSQEKGARLAFLSSVPSRYNADVPLGILGLPDEELEMMSKSFASDGPSSPSAPSLSPSPSAAEPQLPGVVVRD